MKIRTLLVDSPFLLKRSYFGGKNVFTNKFGHIGGLYGYMTKLRKLIKDNKINKVVSVWDGENSGIYRHRIDYAYKANRDKSWGNKIVLNDAEIKKEENKKISTLKQKKRIQAYCEELFIRQIEVDNIEADDIIAHYCQENHNIEDILIYTNDRDFLQLLKLNITLLLDNIKEPVDKSSFFLNFNFHYLNSLTMKILCGDTSDNIEGIKGIAEPTLLKHFPELKDKYVSVNEIYKKAYYINENRKKEKKNPLKNLENLINNKERLKINHQLINLEKPFLNEQAYDELEQLTMPLSSEGRGSKNLCKMMIQDQFMAVYGGTFPNYVQPYFPVIMNEKRILKNFNKKS